MVELSDIYQCIVEQGTRSQPPGPWAGNECDAAFFDLLPKPAELVKRLRKKFPVEDLRRAGVVTVGGKKTVRLSPQLAKNPRYILALRRAAGEKPHDLVAGSSSLRNRTLCSLLQDHDVQEMLESTGQQLAVVTTPEDLAVLISKGIPAAPAGAFHFNDLRGPRLKWFRKMLRLREWGCGAGNAEHQAAAPSPTNGAVEDSPGTTDSPASAAPQAAADDRDDEFAEAGEAEDLADELEDEHAEAAEVEDRADDPGDDCAAADKVKDLARARCRTNSTKGLTGPRRARGKTRQPTSRPSSASGPRRTPSGRRGLGTIRLGWSWPTGRRRVWNSGMCRRSLNTASNCVSSRNSAGWRWTNFGVWSPSPARLKRFRFSVGQRERTGIADILRASLDKDRSPLDRSATGLPPAPATYAEAFLACCASSVDRDFDLFRAEKWKQALKCLQEEWVASILNEARETPDALERKLLYLLASWNGVLHPALLQLARDVADRSGPECGGGPRGLPEEQLKPLLALSNQVRGIIREIDSRRTKRN